MKPNLLLVATCLFMCPLLFPDELGAGPTLPDVVISVSDNTTGNALVGGTWRYDFLLQSVGDSVPATWPSGAVVFSADLPDNLSYGSAELGSGTIYDGGLDCSVSSNTLTCLSVGNFSLIGNTSQVRVSIYDVVAQSSGTAMLPPDGGECMIDPDMEVAESNEGNNSCGPSTIEVRDLPEISNTAWMGVSMWDNVVRVYDHSLDRELNAAPKNLSTGIEVHAINDIVRHPMTGLSYVFHRMYESTTHRLGTFDPVNGIIDIGDTGTRFHDSTFADDGTLYAVGSNGTLYTIDLGTAAPTALCATSFGSGPGIHSGLAWDTNTHELLQIGDWQILTIDLGSLPVNPADPCPLSSVPTNEEMGQSVFASYFLDGVLFVENDTGQFFVVGRDGATARLGRMPMPMHGIIPDDGTLPVSLPPCYPDAWVLLIPGRGAGAELFAMDTGDASLTWVTTLDHKVRAMDYNPVSDRLITLSEDRMSQLNPCSGEALSSVDLSPGSLYFDGIDVDESGETHASQGFDGELYTLNLATGVATMLPGTVDGFLALSISGDEVYVDHTEFMPTDAPAGGSVPSTTALDIYSLSGWPTFMGSLPLAYGPGIESNGRRNIQSIDPRPRGSDLLTVVWRVQEAYSAQDATALPKVLALIDEAGNVTKIENLPASAAFATWGSDRLQKDGFENQ